jgi:hypothetical protein
MARGFKTGGRKKGTPNRLTSEVRERMMEGKTPLDYMMRVMRDGTADVARRDWAAQAEAPYLHPRLASSEVHAQISGPTHEERVTALTEKLAKLDAERELNGPKLLLNGTEVS